MSSTWCSAASALFAKVAGDAFSELCVLLAETGDLGAEAVDALA
jgi:hypothetical protein